jgi:alkane 1-monooxygenase
MRESMSRRIALFIPFTTPLFLLPQVPLFHYRGLIWTLVIVMYLYGVPSLIDVLSGRGEQFNRDKPAWLSEALEYALLPRVLMVLLVVLKFHILNQAVAQHLEFADVVGTGLVAGQILGAFSMVVAHELMHRSSRADKALCEVLLLTVTYPHYAIEHVHGHHRNVATPADPASADLGETIYSFLPRAVFGGLLTAWQIEVQRLKRRGLPWYGLQNRMFRYAVEVAGLYTGVFYVFDQAGVTILLLQSMVGIFTLRVVDYIQHYGLRRTMLSSGAYERIGIQHSWNSGHRFSNAYWLSLARHSDHHVAGSKPFQMLQGFENRGAPQWPGGLPLMFLAALIPPLWFKIMNPHVHAWRDARGMEPQQDIEAGASVHSSGDRASFERLKMLRKSGKIDVSIAAIPHTLRRALLFSEVERYGGVLAVLGLVAFPIVDEAWGMPWGFSVIVALFVAVGIVRYACVRFASNGLLVSASLRNLWAWQDLWRHGYIEVRNARGASSTRSSPTADWRAVLDPQPTI